LLRSAGYFDRFITARFSAVRCAVVRVRFVIVPADGLRVRV
jgi:hypothetical protein